MPKKPKFTKEEVIKAGYQIIKEQGKDNLTARSLAASLNCAISPIFTLFENMEELKNEIFLYTKDEFINLMKESASYFPMFKQFGLLFISYCMDNPNLFMFLLSKTEGDISKIIYLEKDFYNLLEKNNFVLTYPEKSSNGDFDCCGYSFINKTIKIGDDNND